MRRRFLRALLFGLAMLTTACDDGAPTAPEATDPRAGAWAGAIADDAYGTGTIAMRLEQSHDSLIGTWTASLSSVVLTGTVSLLPGVASQFAFSCQAGELVRL